MGNHALDINPDTNRGGHADIAITRRGSDWYFTVCAVMGFSTILIWALSFKRQRTHRLFYYISAAITLISAISYFTQGSNLGWTPIMTEWRRSDPKVHGVYRQIFYVRWIDYFVTTSLILLNLLLTSGLRWPTVLYTVLIDWVMIVSWLVGSLVKSTYKWGYFAFGGASFFFISYVLLWVARQNAATLGGRIYRTYWTSTFVVYLAWICIPVAWGVSEGGNVIAPDSEAVFYGVIDLVSKALFAAIFLWGHNGIDPADVGMDFPEIVSHNEISHAAFASGRSSRFGSLLHRKSKAETEGTSSRPSDEAAPPPAPEQPATEHSHV